MLRKLGLVGVGRESICDDRANMYLDIHPAQVGHLEWAHRHPCKQLCGASSVIPVFEIMDSLIKAHVKTKAATKYTIPPSARATNDEYAEKIR